MNRFDVYCRMCLVPNRSKVGIYCQWHSILDYGTFVFEILLTSKTRVNVDGFSGIFVQLKYRILNFMFVALNSWNHTQRLHGIDVKWFSYSRQMLRSSELKQKLTFGLYYVCISNKVTGGHTSTKNDTNTFPQLIHINCVHHLVMR